MGTASIVAGGMVVAAILWEVFNDLFHPSGTGALSDWVGRHLFGVFKRYPRLLPMAGPLAVVTVIGLWVAALIVGFGLVYLPAYPQDFRTSTGTIPTEGPDTVSVFYFSFETLVTLGYGDLVPSSGLTRAAAALEALVGFALLTASVSSIVLLYPALARMRMLARGVSHLVAAERATGLSIADRGGDAALMALAREVTHARIDLVHFPIVYYFAAGDRAASVANWLGDLVRLAADAQTSTRPRQVRLAGAALDHALDDLAQLLEARFIGNGAASREGIFDAYARDHLLERQVHRRP